MKSLIDTMRFIRKKNQAYKHWCLGSIKLPYLPYQVTIEPTNICNLRCPKCLQAYKDYPRPFGYMPFEFYEKIIKENHHHIWTLYLMYGGESFLHKDFCKMVQLAKEYNIWQTFVHTNATLINEEVSYRIFESGLDNLIISFDGDNKETYEKLQTGANFEKTMENIKIFLKIKKKLRKSKPFVSIKIIHSLKNQPNEISKDFLKCFNGLPINRIYFEKLFAQGSYGKILLEDNNWDIFNQNEMIEKNSDKYFSCDNVYTEVVITWDGKLLRCCRDQEGYHEMGNLNKATIADIWNNQEFLSVRENLKKKNVDGPCKICSSLWCGKPINYNKKNIQELLTFPKYLIRYYYPELSRKMLSIPFLNKYY